MHSRMNKKGDLCRCFCILSILGGRTRALNQIRFFFSKLQDFKVDPGCKSFRGPDEKNYQKKTGLLPFQCQQHTQQFYSS